MEASRMYVTCLTSYSLRVRELQLNLKTLDYIQPPVHFYHLSWEYECISAFCSPQYMCRLITYSQNELFSWINFISKSGMIASGFSLDSIARQYPCKLWRVPAAVQHTSNTARRVSVWNISFSKGIRGSYSPWVVKPVAKPGAFFLGNSGGDFLASFHSETR